MNIKSPIARAAMACAIAATAAAALIPAAASAQSYGYGYGSAYDQRGGYSYDPCARDTSKRATTGGLIGLAAGAAIGSNMAGRHNRNEGTALGGVVGALIGSQVGKQSAACAQEPRPYSYGYSEPAYAEPAYAYAPPPPPPPQRGSYYDDRSSSYDNGCQMVESRIRLPDGRSQTRLVRTCQDSSGRYQIVD
jgi:hypothetical protein